MRRKFNPVWLLVAVLVTVSTSLWLDSSRQKDGEIEKQSTAAESNADAAMTGSELADQVIAACAADDEFGDSVRERGLCANARDTKDTIKDKVEQPSEPKAGRDGRDVTQSQVNASVSFLLPPTLRALLDGRLPADVAAYCAARNNCTAPPLPPLTPRDGIDGRTPSRDDLLALILPNIPAPIPGANGAPGTPGRGITSGPTCLDDGTWSTTYTDGTTETQPGPCRIVLAPEPEPDPVQP